MSKPKTISIDGTDYIRADSASKHVGEPPPMRIVVADRGFVFVGYTTVDSSGIGIANAKCIRVWGTDSDKPGLGWLALNGPTSKTKLDLSGTVRIPTHSIIAMFDTEESKWA